MFPNSILMYLASGAMFKKLHKLNDYTQLFRLPDLFSVDDECDHVRVGVHDNQ